MNGQDELALRLVDGLHAWRDDSMRLSNGIEALLDDLRRYSDPHDLSDPNSPRHVSVALVAIRLKALLEGSKR